MADKNQKIEIRYPYAASLYIVLLFLGSIYINVRNDLYSDLEGFTRYVFLFINVILFGITIFVIFRFIKYRIVKCYLVYEPHAIRINNTVIQINEIKEILIYRKVVGIRTYRNKGIIPLNQCFKFTDPNSEQFMNQFLNWVESNEISLEYKLFKRWI